MPGTFGASTALNPADDDGIVVGGRRVDRRQSSGTVQLRFPGVNHSRRVAARVGARLS
jgi:hypothetical protein